MFKRMSRFLSLKACHLKVYSIPTHWLHPPLPSPLGLTRTQQEQALSPVQAALTAASLRSTALGEGCRREVSGISSLPGKCKCQLPLPNWLRLAMKPKWESKGPVCHLEVHRELWGTVLRCCGYPERKFPCRGERGTDKEAT